MNNKTFKDRIKDLNHTELLVLKTLAELHYLPRKAESVLLAYPELKPEWKYDKAVKNLKAKGYVKSIGIDCSVGHNEKDAHILTRRGYAACKELSYPFNPNWDAMSRRPKHYLRCVICECFFKAFANSLGKTQNELPLVNNKTINEYLKENGNENYSVNGAASLGYYKGLDDIYSLYYISNYNYPIPWEKEITRINIAREICNINVLPEQRNWLNRIVILGVPEAIDCFLKTKNGAKWYKDKNGKFKRHYYKSALYYYKESVMSRGNIYVIPFDDDAIKSFIFYRAAERAESKINEILKNAYIKSSADSRPIIFQKYSFSSFETDNIVVFNLCILNLSLIQQIKDLINSGKEERKIVIYSFNNSVVRYLFENKNCDLKNIYFDCEDGKVKLTKMDPF